MAKVLRHTEIQECKYGINFSWISDNVLVFGLTVTDQFTSTKQAAKRRRQEKASRVKKADLVAAVASAKNVDPSAILEIDERREDALERFLHSGDALTEIVAELREDFKGSLNQSHDFLQLIKQIQGHIKAILEERFPGEPPEVSADKLESEGAIYFAAELMVGKVDATILLDEPNLAFGKVQFFEVHKFVTKHYRIYRAQARDKGVDLRTNGESYSWARYNPTAIGAVIHSLLDNCVKYAPNGSKADIHFKEDSSYVYVDFVSLGPRIEPDEEIRIFLPGYRAAAAKQLDTSGLGFGLAAAKRLSDALELDLGVQQSGSGDQQFPKYFSTTFHFRLEKASNPTATGASDAGPPARERSRTRNASIRRTRRIR